MTTSRLALLGLAAAQLLAGCGSTLSSDPPVEPPPPITFSLSNDGVTPIYLRQECLVELAITDLRDPTRVIGRGGGCPVCDCAAAKCEAYTCGACFLGGVPVAAAEAMDYSWSPVDVTYQSRGGVSCASQRILSPGHYRIDVPVYTTADDAAAKTNPRVVTHPFDLPATETIVVPLAPISS